MQSFSPSSKKDYILNQNKWVFKEGPKGNEFLALRCLVKCVQEAWNSVRRVCQLLSHLLLTVSNFFCISFVLAASTKDGPIKLFCRLLLTECIEYLPCAPVGHTVPWRPPLHLSLTHCIRLCVCGKSWCWLAVIPGLPTLFSWTCRRNYGPLSRHLVSRVTFSSRLEKRAGFFFHPFLFNLHSQI